MPGESSFEDTDFVEAYTDDDKLFQDMKQLGYNPGPITDTTRVVYKKILEKAKAGNISSQEIEDTSVPDEEDEENKENLYLKSEAAYKRRSTSSTSQATQEFYSRPQYTGSRISPSAYDELAFHRRKIEEELRHDPLFRTPVENRLGAYGQPLASSRSSASRQTSLPKFRTIVIALVGLVIVALLYIVLFLE